MTFTLVCEDDPAPADVVVEREGDDEEEDNDEEEEEEEEEGVSSLPVTPHCPFELSPTVHTQPPLVTRMRCFLP